jgi:hypothetical protein
MSAIALLIALTTASAEGFGGRGTEDSSVLSNTIVLHRQERSTCVNTNRILTNADRKSVV